MLASHRGNYPVSHNYNTTSQISSHALNLTMPCHAMPFHATPLHNTVYHIATLQRCPYHIHTSQVLTSSVLCGLHPSMRASTSSCLLPRASWTATTIWYLPTSTNLLTSTDRSTKHCGSLKWRSKCVVCLTNTNPNTHI
jgi:hypothetical protein